MTRRYRLIASTRGGNAHTIGFAKTHTEAQTKAIKISKAKRIPLISIHPADLLSKPPVCVVQNAKAGG